MSRSHPKLAKRARLKWDERDQRHLLLYPERGLALNETGAKIAQLCDGSRSVDQIVDALASANTERAVIERDVIAFLARLSDRKLIE